MSPRAKLTNIAPVFPAQDLKATTSFYTGKLGFTSVEHFDKPEPFAAIYRDEVEIILVQAKRGTVEPNVARYGTGFDAYIDTETVAEVDLAHKECLDKGVAVLQAPHMTEHGSYEFTLQDPDGRIIGVGRISERSTFFANSSVVRSPRA